MIVKNIKSIKICDKKFIDFDLMLLKKSLSEALGLTICDVNGANQYHYKHDYSITSIEKGQNELLDVIIAFVEQGCYDYLYDFNTDTISIKTLKEIVLEVLKEWDKNNKTDYCNLYAKYLHNKEFCSINKVNVAEG